MSLGTFFFSKDMVTGSKFSYWVTILNIFAMEKIEIITYGGYFERFFDGFIVLVEPKVSTFYRIMSALGCRVEVVFG